MDGIHDLGGKVGFGAVRAGPEDDAVFLHDWERRAMAMTFVSFVRGLSNGGEFRHSIERMDPGHYLTSRYYEHWFTALVSRLREAGVVDDASFDALEQRAGGSIPCSRPVHPGAHGEALQAVGEARPPVPEVGQRVRVTATPKVGHTRCPSYVRGRVGQVVRVDPEASVPDLEAHADARRSEAMCSVRFDAAELWGPTAEPARVHVDLWASYLTLEDGTDA